MTNKIQEAVRTAIVKGATEAALAGTTDTQPRDVPTITSKVLNQVAPIVAHATNSEPWYQSRVMWGSIIAIAAPIAAPLISLIIGETVTIDADEQAAIASALAAVGAGMGGLWAIYGRFAAKKPLGS